MNSIIKAVVISLIAAIITIIFQVITTTQTQDYTRDIKWEIVNEMKHKEAITYLEKNSITITVIKAFAEQITEPVH